MTSTRRGRGQAQVDTCERGRRSAPCLRPHRKLEPTKSCGNAYLKKAPVTGCPKKKEQSMLLIPVTEQSVTIIVLQQAIIEFKSVCKLIISCGHSVHRTFHHCRLFIIGWNGSS